MLVDIIDHLPPQTIAMLQALYSRSPKSIRDRLAMLVSPEQVSTFIDKYFIGYGHRSIGDCGSTTAFVEGVSMLTAKAIQDNPLYSGQEASTRYMDFSSVKFDDPLGKAGLQEMCMEFYHRHMPAVVAHVADQHPQQDGEDAETYSRAVKARAFDTMRGFIPAGAHTNLSWHSNLRQMQDRLEWLGVYPNEAVWQVVGELTGALAAKYSSFSSSREKGAWERDLLANLYYYPQLRSPKAVYLDLYGEDPDNYPGLRNRPPKSEVPHWYASDVRVLSYIELDFGSFRDLQRHRNCTIRMPLLTTKLGFEPWYLAQLPPTVAVSAEELLERIQAEVPSGGSTFQQVSRQNYIPMGFRIRTEVEQSIGSWLYRVELRSSQSVHPTLRRVIHAEIREMRAFAPDLAIHADLSADSWSVRRGKQTITEKA